MNVSQYCAVAKAGWSWGSALLDRVRHVPDLAIEKRCALGSSTRREFASGTPGGLAMIRLCALGAGVGLVVDFFEAFDGDMGVELSRGHAGVPQEFLDDAEIGAALQEMGGRGVA
ncbi:hypothetical protein DFR70_105211 [Nocardia tenerifensis]|uniref:Uncharacterized protein n=1 Tax=Nocardia tenerifensis TaxID=228006 RepID=A0A318JZZ1_9NOCA|nr:hypothetical protein DFR70_105211 [Nocardia tenerifensis]